MGGAYDRPTPRIRTAERVAELGETQVEGISRSRLAGRVRDALGSGSVLLTAAAGYGKTTVLEQALSQTGRPSAWISCSDAERAPGILLMRILDAIARAAPGASDALAERLAAAPQQVDTLAATRELLAELPRLLVEPLVLVLDDAEHLDGADDALRLLGQMVSAEGSPLRVALASRRPLDLRVAKPRAAGRLSEFTASDLTFDAGECAALMRSAGGSDPAPEDVDELMRATEGWPLGVGLAIAFVGRAERGTGRAAGLGSLRSAPELHSFLSEELLDSLDAELRAAAIESSVAPVVTPAVAGALRLPDDFSSRIERAGMLVRRIGSEGAFAYHPLLREFLLERLGAERGEGERRRLHGAVAPAIAEAGDPIAAIDHWLEARSWPQAVAAIEREGPRLARTSPGSMRRWLSLLPADARALPTIRSVEGQLEWAAGEHLRAAAVLRDAVRGFRDHPDPPAEWMARFALSDSLFLIGEFDGLDELAEGWDDPAAAPAGILAPATVAYISIVFATIGRVEESDRLMARALQHPDAALLGPVEALRLCFRDTPPGHLDEVLAGMEAAVLELERSDPLNRRLYFLGTLALAYSERGYPDKALEICMRVREGARGGAVPILADSTRAWCSVLYAQQGRLAEAATELALYEGQEEGWRTHIGELAGACVAQLRGDAAATIASADRALAAVAPGPVVFFHRAATQLVPPLVAAGRPDRAREVLEETFALVDRIYPGPRGRFLRGRLLALRAWLRHGDGDSAGADSDLLLFWKEAGETLPHTLRREWERMQAVVWAALERGALEPEQAVEALSRAFPEGLQLVAFLEHPVAAVRLAALEPATASGDPAALVHLDGLADDPDPALAAAASRAAGRLARILPPLRFELLGGFAVRRGAWQAGAAWDRPVDARLVRFLLVNLDHPVPEDQLFEALWPELPAARARKSLQVAISRARRVLDPSAAEHSVIESAGRAYRLVLGERDAVDAEGFRSAAEVALGETDDRRKRLEHARSLWTGEPLPEERYSDWATAYRERLVDRYTAVLAALVDLHEAAGNHADAADAARRLVDLDPLNEGGHRALITAYARSGRTGYALRQYLECRRALVEQLGVEPAAATSRLQARVLAGEPV
ncbi:MAG: BTAD domain-containing putative transcriptional regulator [Solirubrobacterales bacterium]